MGEAEAVEWVAEAEEWEADAEAAGTEDHDLRAMETLSVDKKNMGEQISEPSYPTAPYTMGSTTSFLSVTQ